MKSKEILAVVKRLRWAGEMNFQPSVGKKEIVSFEKENNVLLPPQYKKWLQYSDGGELFVPAGVQLYGVSHAPVIDMKDKSKPAEDFIPIGALSDGSSVVARSGSDTIYVFYNGSDELEVFADFVSFVNSLQNNVLRGV